MFKHTYICKSWDMNKKCKINLKSVAAIMCYKQEHKGKEEKLFVKNHRNWTV